MFEAKDITLADAKEMTRRALSEKISNDDKQSSIMDLIAHKIIKSCEDGKASCQYIYDNFDIDMIINYLTISGFNVEKSNNIITIRW